MNKRTVIINRKHCWVRKSSEMDWYRDAETVLNFEEGEANNPKIPRQPLNIVPIERECEMNQIEVVKSVNAEYL